MRYFMPTLVLCLACACSHEPTREVRAGETPSKTGVTATDQSNASADVELTARVRRALVDDVNLSMMAENLTVVSKSGVVSLRGAVKSAEEAARAESVARGVAGVTRVDAQLDVKP